MIQTKIAQILSPTRVVLAAGSEQGVKEGTEFVIFELSDPIFDPENGDPLGQLELVKGRVEVIQVQERLSRARTLTRRARCPSILDILPGDVRRAEYTKPPIEQAASTG